ncbi:hypothetical protein [Phenylobacterium sp.]|uniref:hypothetical protein n=1 Tax=Phenylobacterium sp. TaxID=1871053 RepID=UPI002F42F71F
MNKPAVSQAQMRRAKKAMEAEGVPFGGFRLRPDGSVDVLPANGNELAPTAPLDDELAEWGKRHGYD